LVSQQIDSFNFFLKTQIRQIIAHSLPIKVMPNRQYKSRDIVQLNEDIKYEITPSNYAIAHKPSYNNANDDKGQNMISPYECRIRNIT